VSGVGRGRRTDARRAPRGRKCAAEGVDCAIPGDGHAFAGSCRTVSGHRAWSGAGVDLHTGTPSPRRIAAAFDRTMDDPSFRAAARRVGAERRALGGAVRAAQLLESSAG
jgi:hypothetical protein